MSEKKQRPVITKVRRKRNTIPWYQIFRPFENIFEYGLILPEEKFQPPQLILPEQVHSNIVSTISTTKIPKDLRADALVTQLPHVSLGVRIADCQSLLIFDSQKKVIANIHAGWRGLVNGIIENTLKIFFTQFSCQPEDIFVSISPSIGPCCFCMTDPQKELPREFHQFIIREKYVDLWEIGRAQLETNGIPSSHIENPKICTACQWPAFPSYRRSPRKNDTSRMISYIALR